MIHPSFLDPKQWDGRNLRPGVAWKCRACERENAAGSRFPLAWGSFVACESCGCSKLASDSGAFLAWKPRIAAKRALPNFPASKPGKS